MNLLIRPLRWLLDRLAAFVVVFAAAWSVWRRLTGSTRRAADRATLPSFYDRYPDATPRRATAGGRADRPARSHRRAPCVTRHRTPPTSCRFGGCAAGTGGADGSASRLPWIGSRHCRRSTSCRSVTTTTSTTVTTGSPRPGGPVGSRSTRTSPNCSSPGCQPSNRGWTDASLDRYRGDPPGRAGPPLADRREAPGGRRAEPRGPPPQRRPPP